MSTTSKALIAIVSLSLIAAAVRAEGIGSKNIGADIFGGISGAKKASVPSSCGTGVIDASAGCPLPMLGM